MESTLTVNGLAEYHGSKPFYHGIVFRIIGGQLGHYDVAYANDDDREPVLVRVRASSLTPIDEAAYWASFQTCPDCEVQYRAEECPLCTFEDIEDPYEEQF